jgi:hypothetical protein
MAPVTNSEAVSQRINRAGRVGALFQVRRSSLNGFRWRWFQVSGPKIASSYMTVRQATSIGVVLADSTMSGIISDRGSRCHITGSPYCPAFRDDVKGSDVMNQFDMRWETTGQDKG